MYKVFNSLIILDVVFYMAGTVAQNGSKYAKIGQKGQNWSKLIKLSQKGQHWSKLIKLGQNRST